MRSRERLQGRICMAIRYRHAYRQPYRSESGRRSSREPLLPHHLAYSSYRGGFRQLRTLRIDAASRLGRRSMPELRFLLHLRTRPSSAFAGNAVAQSCLTAPSPCCCVHPSNSSTLLLGCRIRPFVRLTELLWSRLTSPNPLDDVAAALLRSPERQGDLPG